MSNESFPSDNTGLTTGAEIMHGVRDALPVGVAASAFGMLFGATALNAGFEFGAVMFASATIFAGASQFVFLELWGLQVPAWSIILAVFAVNFRHVLYSASLSRKMGNFSTRQKYFAYMFMVDPLFGAAEQRHEELGLRPAYYFGNAFSLYAFWLIATAIGASFGALITDPQKFGLDFILPIYFLVLVMGFRKRSNWFLVVMVSGVVSALFYKFIGPPWHISLGALAGILAAAAFGVKPKEDADA